MLHEGETPPEGLFCRVRELIYLRDENRFQCLLEDDFDSAELFGDDEEALLRDYQSRGWQLVGGGPLRVVGLPGLAPSTA